MKVSRYCLVVTAWLLASPALTQIVIDLATTQADWTVWGDDRADLTGANATEIADLNGDGIPDLVFSVWGNPSFICIQFGPLVLPAALDLRFDQPDTCVFAPLVPGGRGGATWDDAVVGDIDADGILDLLLTFGRNGARNDLNQAHTVMVFLGRASWPTSLQAVDADWTFHGDALDYLASGEIGDLNGDGFVDLVLSGRRPAVRHT